MSIVLYVSIRVCVHKWPLFANYYVLTYQNIYKIHLKFYFLRTPIMYFFFPHCMFSSCSGFVLGCSHTSSYHWGPPSLCTSSCTGSADRQFERPLVLPGFGMFWGCSGRAPGEHKTQGSISEHGWSTVSELEWTAGTSESKSARIQGKTGYCIRSL